ncbi:MAG: T9SS type A sorting domain-containing protein [Daejeonella sp.]
MKMNIRKNTLLISLIMIGCLLFTKTYGQEQPKKNYHKLSRSGTAMKNGDSKISAGYTLYPNPVSKVLYIEQPGLQKGKNQVQMKVTDMTGRVMYEGVFQPSLAVEPWPVGAYILSVQTDGSVQRLKFMKE